MEAVNSRGIKSIRYDENTRTLDVTYTSSGEYRYFDVGPEVYAWLMKAGSKGKFINRLVKDKYRYERLDAQSVPDEDGDLERLLGESLNSPTSEKS